MAIDQEQLLAKYNQALINGEYGLSGLRHILDRQSGIPGLPDIQIFEPDGFRGIGMDEILKMNPNTRVVLTPTVGLIDGIVTLTPRLIREKAITIQDLIGGKDE